MEKVAKSDFQTLKISRLQRLQNRLLASTLLNLRSAWGGGGGGVYRYECFKL